MQYLLTDKGAELLAKLGTTGKGLHLTRAQTGDGYSENPETLTDLVNGQIDISIADMERVRDESVAKLTLLVTNHEQADEHRIQQIGVFALDEEDGQEVLFIIGQDINGDILPGSDYGRVEFRYVVNIKISNALNIVIDINDTDFLLKKTFYDFVGDSMEDTFYTVFSRVQSDNTENADSNNASDVTE